MSVNDLTRSQRLANAAKLSAWLYVHEPGLFRQLLVVLPKVQRSPLGRLGYFGDDTAVIDFGSTPIPDATVTVTGTDTSGTSIIDANAPAVDLSSFTPDLSTIGPLDTSLGAGISDPISAAVAAPPVQDSSVTDSSASSGGFWSSIGSGLGSAASAVGAVASALVSPAAMTAAGTAAAAYFRGQAQQSTAQAQQAAVQLQLQRTALGASPAPLTYTRNPYTGALTPTYLSNAGAQPLTGSLFNQLSSPGMPASGSLLMWVALGGGILLLAALASR